MSAIYRLYCNRCGVDSTGPHAQSYMSLRAARRNARDVGWTNPQRGRDLCPECSKAAAEADAERRKTDPHPDYY